MNLWQLVSLCLPGALLVVLALLLLPGMVTARQTVTVQLDPVGESGVSGTATLIAAGDGPRGRRGDHRRAVGLWPALC